MSQKLRIAIVCDAIDDSALGGSFISGKRFAAGLAKAGHEIVRITSKFRENRKEEFSYAKKIYEFPHLPKIGAYGVRFGYTSAARLTKIFQSENIDIVYSIHPAILARQAVRAAKRLHIPIVSHSHTLPDLILPGFPLFLVKIVKKVLAFLYKRYDGIIYPTEFLLQKYRDCYFKMPQVAIGNGVDTAIFTPSEKGNNEHFTLLSVARLEQAKNPIVILDALHILHTQKKLEKHIRCIFVGSGPLEKKLHNITAEYGLTDIVTFTGRLPAASARIVKTYQNASVFVLPSLFETEGMVAMEAMACGCPLLVANSPSSAAKDFVHNNGYTFDPHNAQELADKIEKLSTNSDLCEIMRNVSIEEAQKYSFTTSVEKLESFLSSFVSK
ncbi:MAG: glycosyltransferase [candidate division SR1 bacterium]|nr:glycosyltransferase [candidate division SR1 bacterium]